MKYLNIFLLNNNKAILEAANVSRTKRRTKQDEANVQIISIFNQLKEYLLALQENALLEYEVSRSYKTTQKGLRLFQIQNRMEKVVLSTELVENQSQLDPRRLIFISLALNFSSLF
ncbi:MAG: hypothetical protein FIO03_06895 [Nitrosopumilales archaeon]|nr:hypothetical protein [Nitrosopumilales archaeon]